MAREREARQCIGDSSSPRKAIVTCRTRFSSNARTVSEVPLAIQKADWSLDPNIFGEELELLHQVAPVSYEGWFVTAKSGSAQRRNFWVRVLLEKREINPSVFLAASAVSKTFVFVTNGAITEIVEKSCATNPWQNWL